VITVLLILRVVCLCVCVFVGDVVILRIELGFDVRYSLLLLPAASMNF